MSYAENYDRHLRAAILRFAAEAPAETTNISMLEALLPDVGFSTTRDKIETEARWLEEQGFVELTDYRGFLSVTCLQRGLDFLERKIKHSGIQSPRRG